MPDVSGGPKVRFVFSLSLGTMLTTDFSNKGGGMGRPALYGRLFLLLLICFIGTTGSGRAQGGTPPIRLRAGIFNPGQGQRPVLPPGLTTAGYAQNQVGYYIVQFQGPVQAGWKDEVTRLGGEFLDYIPDFAFKVRMNPVQAAQVP